MGTDDLFHKRKARQAKAHRRKIASRAPYERVLIICEGEKTEPNYLKGIRKAFMLHPANVVIADKKHGLDPKGLVCYAIEEYKKDPDFNRVYCVFDKDKHTSYDAALDQVGATRLKGGAKLLAITSVPCFEFWILLHFTYTTRSFCAAGEDSNCALVVAELKRNGWLPDYEKGVKDLFDLLEDKLDTAMKSATRLKAFHMTSGTDNPSTKVPDLIDYLEEMKAKKST